MTTSTKTQTQRVLSKLVAGKTLTSAQARSWGIQRLSARVHELREEEGLNIVSTPYTTRNGARAVRYSLATKKASKKSVV